MSFHNYLDFQLHKWVRTAPEEAEVQVMTPASIWLWDVIAFLMFFQRYFFIGHLIRNGF